LVNISSIAGLLAIKDCPSYSASKAFEINYIEAMRKYCASKKYNITISDIRPGFVDTNMAK
jgi:short-subunit dehydrogenase